MAREGKTSVLYRDLGNGYRSRLRGPSGETLEASAREHEEKVSCEVELGAAMAEDPRAEVLDTTDG